MGFPERLNTSLNESGKYTIPKVIQPQEGVCQQLLSVFIGWKKPKRVATIARRTDSIIMMMITMFIMVCSHHHRDNNTESISIIVFIVNIIIIMNIITQNYRHYHNNTTWSAELQALESTRMYSKQSFKLAARIHGSSEWNLNADRECFLNIYNWG